jgi:hypothetical protein
LRAEGQYVMAPGVSVGERCWQVTNSQPPRMLSEADLRRLLAFLGNGAANPVRKTSVAAVRGSRGNQPAGAAPGVADTYALVRMYRARAPQIGRNNALFETACFARDRGLSQQQTGDALIALHVGQPAVGDHRRESDRAREREGRITIASAFSRPPRDRVDRAKRGLPNAVREKLLQLDLDRLARVLDAMLMAGIAPGQAFTIQQVYERLQPYGIGRGTLYAAVRANLPDEQIVFAQVLGSAPPDPPPPDANAASSGARHTKQCLFGRATNPVKNRGRPRLAFRMPAPDELARRLEVQGKRSDRLAPEDLRSPADYRAALHRALITRAPGQYGRAWLAQRLGVSRRSCRRYERRTGVHVEPVFSLWPVRFGTVEQVMPEEAGPGQFLQDERGRRYPPLRALAHKLLAAGRQLMYVQQDANRYSVPVPAEMSTAGESPHPAAYRPAGYARPDYAPAVTFPPISDSHTPKTTPPVSMIDAQKPASASPSPAETLYAVLRARSPQRSLTRIAAARLADAYGPALINRGLKVLSQKQQVQNPAGFLCAWLRSAAPNIPFPWARAQSESASPASAESSHSDWLRAMKDSPYLQYISNAEDIVRAAAGD